MSKSIYNSKKPFNKGFKSNYLHSITTRSEQMDSKSKSKLTYNCGCFLTTFWASSNGRGYLKVLFFQDSGIPWKLKNTSRCQMKASQEAQSFKISTLSNSSKLHNYTAMCKMMTSYTAYNSVFKKFGCCV